MRVLIFLITLSANLFAGDIYLSDYRAHITDISTLGLTKEALFDKMDDQFINVRGSICSNRALMWVNNLKREDHVDAAKIFLFYTKKTGEVGRKTWWYHVSPMINEAGEMWVMDAGFPRFIDGPLLIKDWLFKFSNSYNCKEILAEDTDLIKLMFKERIFPHKTKHGKYDCYYRITSSGYWTPGSIAENLLGINEEGKPVRHTRDEIDKDELMQACQEATKSKVEGFLSRLFDKKQPQCKKYVYGY